MERQQKIKSLMITTTLLSCLFCFSSHGAEKKQTKGLMPELQINSNDENVNQKKAIQSEVLISKAENQAIQSLISIIKRRKGSADEADLWYRLAELYMRRAKSGRFFDLNRDGTGPLRFAPPAVTSESAIESLKRAIQVYTKIEREFPRYKEMDAVYFNNAFASQQIKLSKNAEALYFKMVNQFPKSVLVPDAYLALGEMAYDEKKFDEALNYFKSIEKYPQAKVYSYGLYKSAWTLYNQRNNEEAINQLVRVVRFHDPLKSDNIQANHNLRSESLRDLAVFFGEHKPADQAYSFFAKIASPDEIGEALYNLAKLYDSHARQSEMEIFLTDFAKKQPYSPFRVKMEILMINGNETARKRAEALKHLVIASELCKPNSEWRTRNSSIAEPECDYDFAKSNVEIAKQWWELWQKNKKATAANEIAKYTQEAFRLHLEREDPIKPDTKSRYAYAELLFQLGEFRKASEQYEFVGKNSLDTQIAHDATYSALVALEKAKSNEKSNNSSDDVRLTSLSQYYIQKYPNGEHRTQLEFKLGFIAYENSQFVEAEKWLRPLANNKKAGEFKVKAEDLILDILNSRKDYAGIKEFSKNIIKQTPDSSRKNKLSKIQTEADYAEIQEFATSQDSTQKYQAANKLLTFFKENKGSPLAKNSLWQALSLFYSDGKVIEGAETALLYAKEYPEDKRTIDALKDAAKYYTDAGLILPAAKTMDMLVQLSSEDRDKYSEAAVELYLLEGQNSLVQDSLKKQLAKASPQEQGKILTRLLTTMKGQENSAEFKSYENKIVQLGFEPEASRIRVSRVEALLESGKYTEAFNAAKPLVSKENNSNDDIRARARLAQARVLEKEFIDTRTKTTVEKLALVLSIKTEKLDKAQTAFLTSAKIAQDPNIKLQALRGLNRIYTNYVDTVGHPILKDEKDLSAEDKKLLAEQLTQLTAPIAQKKKETDDQLKSLAKDFKAAGSDETDYASLPFEETVRPQIRGVRGENLAPFLPNSANLDLNQRHIPSGTDKCSVTSKENNLTPDSLVKMANICIQQKKAAQAEQIVMTMIRQDSKSGLGSFYLSLIASLKAQHEKAEWLIDLAIKKSGEKPLFSYQKARALYGQNEVAQGNSQMIRAFDLGLKTPETILLQGVVSFAQGDCLSMIESFNQLGKSDLEKYNLIPALSECHAQTGEFDKAVTSAEAHLKTNSGSAEVWLQVARVQENFKFDSTKAANAYQQALAALSKSEANSEMKVWIQNKVEFLKGKSAMNSTRETASDGKDK